MFFLYLFSRCRYYITYLSKKLLMQLSKLTLFHGSKIHKIDPFPVKFDSIFPVLRNILCRALSAQ